MKKGKEKAEIKMRQMLWLTGGKKMKQNGL